MYIAAAELVMKFTGVENGNWDIDLRWYEVRVGPLGGLNRSGEAIESELERQVCGTVAGVPEAPPYGAACGAGQLLLCLEPNCLLATILRALTRQK